MATQIADRYRIENDAADKASIQAAILDLATDVGLLRMDVRTLMWVVIPVAFVALALSVVALILTVQVFIHGLSAAALSVVLGQSGPVFGGLLSPLLGITLYRPIRSSLTAHSATPASAGQGAPRAILHGVRRAAPLLLVAVLYALGFGLLLDVALRVW
jgi:hypothetical protein